MKNIKNAFLVSALSLGLIVGAVGVAGAATSTNDQQQIADWIANDPNPMVMNMNTAATPATPQATTPVASQNDLYNQMIYNCVQIDQQMMQQYGVNPQNQALMQRQWQNAQKNGSVNNNGFNRNSQTGNQMSGNWSGSGNMDW